jgi:2-polyprenyl-3-methyl-5-hydroxy-6-metoxy-1,4-benzoquinol methylase
MAGEELTLPGLHQFLAEEIPRRIPDLAIGTAILDLGCGSGAWLSRLGRLGFSDLTGVDNGSFVTLPPSGPIAYWSANLDRTSELNLGQRRFGLITAIEVFEHLENPGHFLEHASRHLADEGWLLLTTPNVQSLRARVRYAVTGKLAQFDPTGVEAEPTHIYPVFLTCLERLLSRHGLEIAQRWTYPLRAGLGTRLRTRMFVQACAVLFPDPYAGDTLCVLIKRAHHRQSECR